MRDNRSNRIGPSVAHPRGVRCRGKNGSRPGSGVRALHPKGVLSFEAPCARSLKHSNTPGGGSSPSDGDKGMTDPLYSRVHVRGCSIYSPSLQARMPDMALGVTQTSVNSACTPARRRIRRAIRGDHPFRAESGGYKESRLHQCFAAHRIFHEPPNPKSLVPLPVSSSTVRNRTHGTISPCWTNWNQIETKWN
jgi:hypothetical protein